MPRSSAWLGAGLRAGAGDTVLTLDRRRRRARFALSLAFTLVIVTTPALVLVWILRTSESQTSLTPRTAPIFPVPEGLAP